MEDVERATAPFQCALMRERVADALCMFFKGSPSWTCALVMSVDGIGACDLISRLAMMQGIRKVHAAVVLFVSMFCGSASTSLWGDDEGTTHKVMQGEGGNRGL